MRYRKHIIQSFFARRDGCSRPLPLGVPRAMSISDERKKSETRRLRVDAGVCQYIKCTSLTIPTVVSDVLKTIAISI